MKQLILATATLVLSAAATAQVTYLVSPKANTSKDGQYYCYYFGAYQNGHYMFFDGEYRNTTMVHRELAYRPDGSINYGSTYAYAVGRSWTNVTIHMADTDMASISRTWTANALSTPTLVYSGSMTWPTISSPTGGPPRDFTLKIPFGGNGANPLWIYKGVKDFLTEYQFQGGTLANATTWGTTSARTYYLDGMDALSYSYTSTRTLYGGYSSAGGCHDSGNTTEPYTYYGGYHYTYLYIYGDSYSSTSYRNKMRFYSYNTYVSKTSPVIAAYALGGIEAGVRFAGVVCNKLYINPALMVLTASANPTASTNYGYAYHYPVNPTGSPTGSFPIIPNSAGIDIWSQAAWQDTNNRGLRLTNGCKITVPAAPPPPPQRLEMYHYNPTSLTSISNPDNYYYRNPVVRYTK